MPAMENMAGNIILVGLMGAGKTTLGRLLAQHLQYPFFDSDITICERTGVSVPTIFEMEGEAGFRLRESAVIKELCQQRRIVLATGGGAVLNPDNCRVMRENGLVIYLHTQPEILFKRTCRDKNRPLLQVDNPLQRLQELYQVRDYLYRQTAHMVIDTQQNTAVLLQQLLEYIKSYKVNHDHSIIR